MDARAFRGATRRCWGRSDAARFQDIEELPDGRFAGGGGTGTLIVGNLDIDGESRLADARWKAAGYVKRAEEFTTDEMLGRWMGLFSDVAMGGMLETSLDKLKSKAESAGS